MKKYCKWILAAIAILLIGLLIWFLINYFSVPRLPPWEKEKVMWAFSKHKCFPEYDHIWYEENGYAEEPGVTRYIGKYGDYYAFLVIGNVRCIDPVKVNGLSRQVDYPVQAVVALYNAKGTLPFWRYSRLCYIQNLSQEEREMLLTDEQWERLTCDIEKLAKEHN